jgi:hypothetical protein
MKTFFFKYKTLILVGITALLFSLIALQQCSEKQAAIKAVKAEQAKNEVKIRNEVQAYYLERKNAELDSLKKVEQIKTWKARTDAIIYKAEADRLKKSSRTLEEKYNQLIAENAPCPDLLESAIIRIDTLKAENFTLEKTCEQLDIEAQGYSRQLFMCEQQRTNLDTLLHSARNEIKADSLVIAKLKSLDKKEKFREKVTNIVGGAVIVAQSVVILIKSI